MSDPTGYAGYVDTRYLELAAELARLDKRRTYEVMHVQLGQRVLDVGSGPGIDTLALAALVGESGAVCGVDYDAAMVAEADRRAIEAGAAARVRHVVASAASLPFADVTFDAARSERLLQHISDPDAVLREMNRVTRPGGWVVVLETDYSSLTIDSEQVEVERRLARVAAERVRSGYAARSLRRLFARAGLTDLTVEVRPQVFTSYPVVRRGWLDAVEPVALARGAVTPVELARWHDELEAAEAGGAFFASLNHILVAGMRAPKNAADAEVR
ncbi:MAG: class I SAM-dependent methyltransferase [Ktedonobacterales bacterium]